MSDTPTPPASQDIEALVKRLRDMDRFVTEGPRYLMAQCREAADALTRLASERDALTRVIDPHNTNPDNIARIIMRSVENSVRASEAEAKVERLEAELRESRQ